MMRRSLQIISINNISDGYLYVFFFISWWSDIYRNHLASTFKCPPFRMGVFVDVRPVRQTQSAHLDLELHFSFLLYQLYSYIVMQHLFHRMTPSISSHIFVQIHYNRIQSMLTHLSNILLQSRFSSVVSVFCICRFGLGRRQEPQNIYIQTADEQTHREYIYCDTKNGVLHTKYMYLCMSVCGSKEHWQIPWRMIDPHFHWRQQRFVHLP